MIGLCFLRHEGHNEPQRTLQEFITQRLQRRVLFATFCARCDQSFRIFLILPIRPSAESLLNIK
jgi:hypothetical protein